MCSKLKLKMVAGNKFSSWFLLTILGVILGIQFAAACDGYDLVVKRIKPCEENADYVITMDRNVTIDFSDDCKAFPKFRTVWKKFDKAEVKYTITKHNKSQMQGKFDLCDNKYKSNIRAICELLGIPKECPIPKGNLIMDGDEGYDMVDYKMVLAMFKGRTKFKLEIDHFDAGTSCVIADIYISKADV